MSQSALNLSGRFNGATGPPTASWSTPIAKDLNVVHDRRADHHLAAGRAADPPAAEAGRHGRQALRPRVAGRGRLVLEGHRHRQDRQGRPPASRYVDQFLKPLGISFVATAPVRDPVFDGYPGTLQVHRSAEQGPFNEADLSKLTAAAAKLGEQLAEVRAARAGTSTGRFATGWTAHGPQPAVRHGRQRLGPAEQGRLQQHRRPPPRPDRHRGQAAGPQGSRARPWASTRLLLPDSAGDHWTLNCRRPRQLPRPGRTAPSSSSASSRPARSGPPSAPTTSRPTRR